MRKSAHDHILPCFGATKTSANQVHGSACGMVIRHQGHKARLGWVACLPQTYRPVEEQNMGKFNLKNKKKAALSAS